MAYTIPPDNRAGGNSGHLADHTNLADWITLSTKFNIMNTAHGGGATTGSSDNTTAIQAALDAAGSAGGGIVTVPYGTFILSNFTIHGNTILRGQGRGSILKAKAGTSGNFLALNTPASDRGVVLENITIDANNQTSLTGIYLDNTGVASDSLHRLTNVCVLNSKVDGIHLGPAVIETVLVGCYVYNSGRYGYNFDVGATDNRIIGCSSALSLSHGFYIQGNNNHFTDCKAFYAGYTGSGWTSSIHGFLLQPSAAQDLHCVQVIGCEAQNNAQDGFRVDGAAAGASAQHIVIMGCVSDGNNEVAGTGNGYTLQKVTNSSFIGNSSRSQSSAHVYGLAVYSTGTGTKIEGNDLSGASGEFYVDGAASGYQFVGGSMGLPIPASAALPSGWMGVDAPFGTAAVRFYNPNASGNIQLVPGSGGLVENYVGGNDTCDATATGFRCNAGYGFAVVEGSNCKQGAVALVSGSKVVSNTSVTANSRILLTSNVDGGTPGWLRVSARTPGTSFTITSSSGTDTSTVAYQIFEPG
jgi:Pectate lyase superfamily protein